MTDIESIQQLKARYFHTLDTKNWDAFRDVFTDDFTSDTTSSGGAVIHGADKFVAFVKKALSGNTTVHHGHMPDIQLISENFAKGMWAMEDLVRFFGCIDLHGFGHYHEEYKKVNGQWCIHYSRLTRLRMDIRFLFFSVKVPQFLIRRMNQKGHSSSGNI